MSSAWTRGSRLNFARPVATNSAYSLIMCSYCVPCNLMWSAFHIHTYKQIPQQLPPKVKIFIKISFLSYPQSSYYHATYLSSKPDPYSPPRRVTAAAPHLLSPFLDHQLSDCYHSQHPLFSRSFTQGSKPTFSINHFYHKRLLAPPDNPW